MFGRLGMYYRMHDTSPDQHGRLGARNIREPVVLAIPPSGDIGMFVRMAGVIAAVCIAVTLVTWSAG